MLDHEQTGQNMNVLNNNEYEVTVRECCRMNSEGKDGPKRKRKKQVTVYTRSQLWMAVDNRSVGSTVQ